MHPNNPTTNNPDTATNPPELWTVADVAHYMRMSKSWVYKNYSRYFTTYRTGQCIRFDPEEVKTAIHNMQERPQK